jgi:transmembrane sensor
LTPLHEQLQKLLEKPEWTEEEKLWLLNYLEHSEASELNELLRKKYNQDIGQFKSIDSEVSAQLLKHIHQEMGIEESYKGKLRRMWVVRMAAASVILLVLALGIFYWTGRQQKDEITKVENRPQPLKNDVAPGGDRAILTLADGTQVALDKAANGDITRQGNVRVINADGQLSYEASQQSSELSPAYNTVATPRGGQYQLIMADGTKVWLNAASSLRYPTAFTGIERVVELTGEGYFEVAHDASRPFRVKVADMDVKVLGTHFNINSYTDEAAIKTTLLEGSVKVNVQGQSALLQPGQQSQVLSTAQARKIYVQPTDVEEAVAWKNGRFQFEHSDIKTIMRQIERWYDVEVVFEGTKPSEHYSGKISRNVNVSEVLRILELSGIRFRIDGKKIIVRS